MPRVNYAPASNHGSIRWQSMAMSTMRKRPHGSATTPGKRRCVHSVSGLVRNSDDSPSIRGPHHMELLLRDLSTFHRAALEHFDQRIFDGHDARNRTAHIFEAAEYVFFQVLSVGEL